jgi:epoxyqueuosine reductase
MDQVQAPHARDGRLLVDFIQQAAGELGFSQIGVSGVDLSAAEPGLLAWLEAGFHGSMAYMANHGLKRARPAELVPGTVSVITASLPYLPDLPGQPENGLDSSETWVEEEWARLQTPDVGVVSMYARGRDYHRVVRSRLQQLAQKVQERVGPWGHRVFCDSAPVLEVELAQRSGLGWRGKHTLALQREGGSMFFLGEIFVDMALPPTPQTTPHCGSCTACLDICPTRAIVAPYRLDARRCVSYLTIEHDGPIDPALRPLMGNRIYGCDDCQLACPWNKYARRSPLPDFVPREGMRGAGLLELWSWSEEEFFRRTEGSAIRRIGWTRWRRNLAVAMGNALRTPLPLELAQEFQRALTQARPTQSPLVQEHLDWALAQAQ